MFFLSIFLITISTQATQATVLTNNSPQTLSIKWNDDIHHLTQDLHLLQNYGPFDANETSGPISKIKNKLAISLQWLTQAFQENQPVSRSSNNDQMWRARYWIVASALYTCQPEPSENPEKIKLLLSCAMLAPYILQACHQVEKTMPCSYFMDLIQFSINEYYRYYLCTIDQQDNHENKAEIKSTFTIFCKIMNNVVKENTCFIQALNNLFGKKLINNPYTTYRG